MKKLIEIPLAASDCDDLAHILKGIRWEKGEIITVKMERVNLSTLISKLNELSNTLCFEFIAIAEKIGKSAAKNAAERKAAVKD